MIEMTFEPKGKKAGMLISLATLIMMIASALILKFTKLKVPALLKMCAAFIYLELYNIVIVAMFLIPVVAAIPALIYQIVIRLMQLFCSIAFYTCTIKGGYAYYGTGIQWNYGNKPVV